MDKGNKSSPETCVQEQATRLYPPDALRMLVHLSLPPTELLDPRRLAQPDERKPARARRFSVKLPLFPAMSRTCIMICLTIAAAGFALWSLLGSGDAASASNVPSTGSTPVISSTTPTISTAGVRETAERDIDTQIYARIDANAGFNPRPRNNTSPESAKASSSERAAADLLISSRDEQALDLYRELAKQRPDQPAYSAIAKILQRRIVRRCKERSPSGDKSCNSAD